MKRLFYLTALAMTFAWTAQATPIVGAAGVTASTERNNVPAINTIDQSGLSTGYTSGVTDFDTYINSNPLHALEAAGNEWFSDIGNTTATITFDLGLILRVDRVALWVEESSGFGAAELLFSTDGMSFSPLTTINPIDNPLADYPAEVFGFGPTDMRFFRMNLSDCPQPDPGATQECSLGEIAFSATSIRSNIPLPSSGVLLLAGLAVLGVARRFAKHLGADGTNA